ncbi:MAG: CRISPR-associated endonuclease Cas2 [Desulfovibrio sp.]|nr:CRISPR-associated endonuclease Cas2 [Desulfovibrio sp.]
MDNHYLVLYDIADGKRLTRAAHIVLDYGIRIVTPAMRLALHEVRVLPALDWKALLPE